MYFLIFVCVAVLIIQNANVGMMNKLALYKVKNIKLGDEMYIKCIDNENSPLANNRIYYTEGLDECGQYPIRLEDGKVWGFNTDRFEVYNYNPVGEEE
jgi:hypothetical protein